MHENTLTDLRDRIREVQKAGGRSRRYPSALKREVVEAVSAWEREGGDARTLCKSLRVDAQTVRDWQQRAGVGDGEGANGDRPTVRIKPPTSNTHNEGAALFVPVQIRSESTRDTGCRVEIVIRGERRIRFDAVPDKGVLSDLVTCLEAIPC